MKNMLLSVTIIVFATCVLNAANQQPAQQVTAQQTATQTEMTPEQFKSKMNDLINKRRQISMQIYQQRVQVIKDDPNLRILHKAILDLHTKMAKQLNANPKIVPLVDKGKEIDSEMEKLIKNYKAAGKSK